MNPLRRNTLWVLWSVLALAAVVIFGSKWLWSVKLHFSFGIPPDIHDNDFAGYWAASRLTLSGEHLLLFDQKAWLQNLQLLFGADTPGSSWSSPPHLLLLIWPLGLMPFVAALSMFLGITACGFVATAMLMRNAVHARIPVPLLLLAISGFLLMALDATQDGLLTGALTLLLLSWKEHKPVLAGLSLALLTMKPQLAFMLPLLLVADRNWRALAWAGTFATGLVALSTVIFGTAAWSAYFGGVLESLREMADEGLATMPGTLASLRMAGMDYAAALGIHAGVALAALALSAWLIFRSTDGLIRMFAALAGTFLISPFAFGYDMGALAVIAALLAIRTQGSATTPIPGGGGGGTGAAVMIALVAALPGLILQVSRAGAPVAPLVLAFGLLVAARLSGRPPPSTAGHVPPPHATPSPAPG